MLRQRNQVSSTADRLVDEAYLQTRQLSGMNSPILFDPCHFGLQTLDLHLCTPQNAILHETNS
jgi:hypothetical protein